MDIAFIEQLIALHERCGLTELEYSSGGERIRLSKVAGLGTAPSVDRAVPVDGWGTEANSGPPVAPAPATESGGVAEGSSARVVRAPLAGTFHLRPAPGAPPYVIPGDRVLEGQMLAVIEAMKVLNAVESEWAGRVVQVIAQDGAAVSAGDELLRIDLLADGHV